MSTEYFCQRQQIVNSVILTPFGCLGNHLGSPPFSSSHMREVREAICLRIFHGLLLHCAAWLTVWAWEVWKCGQADQLALETQLSWAQFSCWMGRSPSKSSSETTTVLCSFCYHLWTLGQPSSASPTISRANSRKAQQQRASFHTKSLCKERHPWKRTCSPSTYQPLIDLRRKKKNLYFRLCVCNCPMGGKQVMLLCCFHLLTKKRDQLSSSSKVHREVGDILVPIICKHILVNSRSEWCQASTHRKLYLFWSKKKINYFCQTKYNC